MTPAQQLLVSRNTGVVEGLAAMVLRSWPDLGRAELVAVGNLALTEAACRYDDQYGTEFATFAWCRVRGAMIEYAKKEHFRFDRRARAVVRDLAEGLLPDDEASRETVFGETPEQSLERTTGWTQRIAAAMFVAATRATSTPDPEEQLSDIERSARGKRDLGEALAQLRAEDRKLIGWYYEEQRGVDWIAATLDVSTKTVRRKLERVRGQLAERMTQLDE